MKLAAADAIFSVVADDLAPTASSRARSIPSGPRGGRGGRGGSHRCILNAV